MSNGARLTAVIVVVAVAAIGLYFAIMSPGTPAQNEAAPATGSLTEPNPAAGMEELKGPEALDAAAGANAPPPQAFGEPSIPAGPGGVTASAAGTKGPETSAGSAPAPSAGPTPAAPGAAPASAPTTKTLTEVAPSASIGREYTIKSGDTLEGIARAELGDGQRWKQIVEMNPGLDPKSLKIGRKITLPVGAAAPASATKPSTTESPSAGTGNSYTVQKGDTLFGIARKVYGSATDADIKRIVDANQGTLKSKDTPLKPGMKLSVPAKR